MLRVLREPRLQGGDLLRLPQHGSRPGQAPAPRPWRMTLRRVAYAIECREGRTQTCQTVLEVTAPVHRRLDGFLAMDASTAPAHPDRSHKLRHALLESRRPPKARDRVDSGGGLHDPQVLRALRRPDRPRPHRARRYPGGPAALLERAG